MAPRPAAAAEASAGVAPPPFPSPAPPPGPSGRRSRYLVGLRVPPAVVTAKEKARERQTLANNRYRPPGKGAQTWRKGGGDPAGPGARGGGRDLPITESLLFPRIHYHQCPACVCECEGTRRGRPRPGHRRRGGRRGRQRSASPPTGGREGGREGGGGSGSSAGGSAHGPISSAHSEGGDASNSAPRALRHSGSTDVATAPAAAAAAAASSPRCARRHRRSSNYIRETRATPRSVNVGSFRLFPTCSVPSVPFALGRLCLRETSAAFAEPNALQSLPSANIGSFRSAAPSPLPPTGQPASSSSPESYLSSENIGYFRRAIFCSRQGGAAFGNARVFP